MKKQERKGKEKRRGKGNGKEKKRGKRKERGSGRGRGKHIEQFDHHQIMVSVEPLSHSALIPGNCRKIARVPSV